MVSATGGQELVLRGGCGVPPKYPKVAASGDISERRYRQVTIVLSINFFPRGSGEKAAIAAIGSSGKPGGRLIIVI